MVPVPGFEGRRIAVFGLGRSGLTAARALKAGGALPVLWDDSVSSRMQAEAEGFDVEDLTSADWAGFAAVSAFAAGFASALASEVPADLPSDFASALPSPLSARLRRPSFLKSVSYQPLPARRKLGAVSWRRTCGSAHSGHWVGSASDSFCRRSKVWPQAAHSKA